MTKAASHTVRLPPGIDTALLFGSYDQHLKLIEEGLSVRLAARGEEVHVQGEPDQVKQTGRVLDDLAGLVKQGFVLRPEDVSYAVQAVRDNPQVSVKQLFMDTIPIATKKRFILPKSPTQKRYVEAIAAHDITVGIGPAGTGKTYLAMAMAVAAWMKRAVSRIILVRPAVEAGERLGFLPGDLYAKINPYLRPLYDALYDMMEFDRANRMIERGEIEIAPLAYMRGRTLNDAFIILDEAQNATYEQMKMFLTRLGFDSKAVITGDVTQVDLPSDRDSGLVVIQEVLARIEGIAFVHFTDKDVVRHRLVQEVVKAYERHEATHKRPARRR